MADALSHAAIDGSGTASAAPDRPSGSVAEVLWAFLRLGLTSFGGPIAHLGYYRDAFVVRRRWLDDAAYTDLIALCQFLPGPASSQVAFSIGLMRAGYRGGLAALVGFALPSAVVMTACAYGAGLLEGPLGRGLLHGLKLVAVAIVAQAVLGMARTLSPDRARASIACAAAAIVALSMSSFAQLMAIALGGLAGLLCCRGAPAPVAGSLRTPVSRGAGLASLFAFGALLVALPLLAPHVELAGLLNAFYRSGALVFGGGHVVLPLLSEAFVNSGRVSEDAFVAGYGAVQAVPGPLFSFAAYLGAIAGPSRHGVLGAVTGLIGVFLPGLLALMGALPFWEDLRRRPDAQALMRGINAAVVGLLAAALYDPLWTSAVTSSVDFVIALGGFVMLTAWHARPLLVVCLGAGAGLLRVLL